MAVFSITVFIGQLNPTTGIPEPTMGINFTYTDELENECLHIYSNSESYTSGLSHAEVYLAVANNCGATQDVELIAYFDDERKRVGDVSVLTDIVRQQEVPTMTTVCETQTSSSTGETTEVCEEVAGETQVIETSTREWFPLPLIERTPVEVAEEDRLLCEDQYWREYQPEYRADLKSEAFNIGHGDVVYYKVIINFQPNMAGNFYFEAIGSAGGYGHLE